MEIFLDALKDSALVLPFLVVIYLAMEIVEDNFSESFSRSAILKKKYAPALGVAAGLIPQCGFSVVSTELYNKKIITVGTLIAVYITTSDEAIPILLSNPQSALKLLPLLGIKVAFALVAGFGVDFFMRLYYRKKAASSCVIEEKKEVAAEQQTIISETAIPNAIESSSVETLKSEKAPPVSEDEKSNRKAKALAEFKKKLPRNMLNALLRSAKIFLYIFIINLVFGFILDKVGMDKIEAFLDVSKYYQPFFAALVGAIPNCASSVLLAEMYSMDLIGLGAAVAGLSMNAGLGFTVLFKSKINIKRNLILFLGLYVASSLLGFIIGLF